MNDFETAKEMANSENFSHRPVHFVGTHLRGTGKRQIGVIGTSGDQWRRNRRFSLSTLKGWFCNMFRISCFRLTLQTKPLSIPNFSGKNLKNRHGAK